MDKHTPGPWRIVAREVMEDGSVYPCHVVGGSADYQICMLESPAVAKLAEENPGTFWAINTFVGPNAHLIAAAPELLAVAKEAHKAMATYFEDHPHFAPEDCYATGPVTGNDHYDLVRCPGCCAKDSFTALIAKIDAALSKARGEV